VSVRTSSVAGHACAAVVTALILTACAGPTHSRGDYEHKVANTAEALQSSAQTVLLVADLVEHGRALTPYAARVVSQAEDDATSVQQTFDSRQPPDSASDELRQRADDVIEKVVSAISDARIGVRGGDLSGLADAAAQLHGLLPDLQRLQGVA